MKRIAIAVAIAGAIAGAAVLAALYGCKKTDDGGVQHVASEDSPRKIVDWYFSTDKDKMTGKSRGIASVPAIDGTKSSLILKCDISANRNDLYAQVLFSQYIGKSRSRDTGRSRELEYRVDSGPVKQAPSYYGDTYVLVTEPDGVRQFAIDLSKAKYLFIRATSYNYSTVDAEFNVGGAAEAIRAVAKTCGVESPV